jgi:predicted DNA binding protein
MKKRILILSILATLLFVSCFKGGSSSSTTNWKEADNSRDAYEITVDMLYASQGSSIKMCGYSNATVTKNGTIYTVSGYYDTVSPSNRKVRMDYTIVVEQTAQTKFIQKSASVSNARYL